MYFSFMLCILKVFPKIWSFLSYYACLRKILHKFNFIKSCYFFYRPSNVLRINIILMWRSPVTVSIGIFRCIFYTISTPSMLTRALKQTGCNIYFKTINVTWFSLLRLVYDTKLLSGDDYERPSLNQLKQYILHCCTI